MTERHSAVRKSRHEHRAGHFLDIQSRNGLDQLSKALLVLLIRPTNRIALSRAVDRGDTGIVTRLRSHVALSDAM